MAKAKISKAIPEPSNKEDWRQIRPQVLFVFRYSFHPESKRVIGLIIPGPLKRDSRQDGSILISWDSTSVFGGANAFDGFQPFSELGEHYVIFDRYLEEDEHVELYGSQKMSNQGEDVSAAADTFPGPARSAPPALPPDSSWLPGLRSNPRNLTRLPKGIPVVVTKTRGASEGERSQCVLGPTRTNPSGGDRLNIWDNRRGYRTVDPATDRYAFLSKLDTGLEPVNGSLQHAVINPEAPEVTAGVKREMVGIDPDHPAHALLRADNRNIDAIPYGVAFNMQVLYPNGSLSHEQQGVKCHPGEQNGPQEAHVRVCPPGGTGAPFAMVPRRQEGNMIWRFVSFPNEKGVFKPLRRYLLTRVVADDSVTDEPAPDRYTEPDIQAAYEALQQDPYDIAAIPDGVPYIARTLSHEDHFPAVNSPANVRHNIRHIVLVRQWNPLEDRVRDNWRFVRFASSKDMPLGGLDPVFDVSVTRMAVRKKSKTARKPVKGAAKKAPSA